MNRKKTKLKTGVVKKIDRETMKVIILGPIKNDRYQYMKVSLHCVSYFEENRNEAFEFLRENLPGLKVKFDDYRLGKEIAADIFLDKTLVSFLLVKEGLGEPIPTSKPTKFYEDLLEANKIAKDNEKGIYSNEKKKKKKKKRVKDLKTFVGKTVKGYLEFNYELDFVFVSEELGEPKQHFSFTGIKIPIISREHVTKLNRFLDKNGYQRSSKYTIKKVTDDYTASVYDQDVTQDDSVLRQLLINGWARLTETAATDLEPIEFLGYKSLQDEAINKKKRIWKNFKGDKRKEIPQMLQNFQGLVQEIHSGDNISIKNKLNNEVYRVNLSNIKAPRIKKTNSEPFAFEAKEYMRKNFIGKEVNIRIDAIKDIKTETKEFTITFATIFYDSIPIGTGLLRKGLAEFVTPRLNDKASIAIKSYSEAYEEAKKKNQGIHSDSTTDLRYLDLSFSENRKKFKTDFLLKGVDDWEPGVVEYCFSGSRYKLRFDKNKLYFIFSLNGIKTLMRDPNMPNHERFANLATNFAKSNASQRDVLFKISKIDKKGIAHGILKVGGKDFAQALLRKGYAHVDEYMTNANQDYDKLQEKAKNDKMGIWKENILGEPDNYSNPEPAKRQKFEMKVSYCLEFPDITLQNISADFKNLQNKIDQQISALPHLKEPLTVGTMGLGKFDDKYFRCKVKRTKNKNNQYHVLFVDYGEKDYLEINQLKICPNEIKEFPYMSFIAHLDYVLLPYNDPDLLNQAFVYFEDFCADQILTVIVNAKSGGASYSLIYPKGKEATKDCLNYQLVEKGLAYLDMSSEVAKHPEWLDALDKGLKINPDIESAATMY